MTTALTHPTAAPKLALWRLRLPQTATGWITLTFILGWIGVVVLPLAIISVFSLFSVHQYQIVHEVSLDTWAGLVDSGRWLVVLRTLQFAISVTLIEIALAFPFALWLAKGCRSDKLRACIITLLTIPFFLDASSRIIVWRSILGSNGLINSTLMDWGLIETPISWLLYSSFSVHFGMIGSYFPSAVFPIFLTLSLIDDDLIKASSDLGASPRQTLQNVILPLALPGLIGAVIFTLIPLMAAWIEPQLLGGGQVNLLGQSIQSAISNLNYPVASALSTVVIVLLALLLGAFALCLRGRVNMANLFQGHGH